MTSRYSNVRPSPLSTLRSRCFGVNAAAEVRRVPSYGSFDGSDRRALIGTADPRRPFQYPASTLGTRGHSREQPRSIATATVDRLLHPAHVLITEGQDSYRLAKATAGKGVKLVDLNPSGTHVVGRKDGHHWGEIMAAAREKGWP